MKRKTSTGILIGKAPYARKAEDIVKNGSKCPYCAHYASIDTLIMGLFVVPSDHIAWLTSIQTHPEVLGLQYAEVLLPKETQASSPWSRGEVRPVLRTAPCNSSPCTECPQYPHTCAGCPATIYYQE
ncbi:MAG: hypothetical protein HXS47_10290 [Theionarchaea archaeon]|nr:hypothetical protein [Theionarchaea archaeon]